MIDRKTIVAAALALATGACSGIGSNHALPAVAGGNLMQGAADGRPLAVTSILKLLKKQAVIGSTVDPLNGDVNPYGLAIPPYGYKKIAKGNAYVCNFNNKANVQGTGTTVVSLAPAAGSKPARFIQSPKLLGCAADAFDSRDNLWTANFAAKSVVMMAPTGAVQSTFKGGNYVRPFGLTYTTTGGLYPSSSVFVSDASTGSIILTSSCAEGASGCTYPGTAIVTGFPVNHGKPGSILGPSGLTFDPYACTTLQGKPACGALYVVDGVNNSVVAIYNVLNIRKAKSIIVNKGGLTFSGPLKSWAKVIFHGAPLKAPISAALVGSVAPSPSGAGKPGNLVIGNTAGPNVLVEISEAGKVLDQVNVDKGAPGALFGLQAVGYGAATQLFFNDDNANNLQVLQK